MGFFDSLFGSLYCINTQEEARLRAQQAGMAAAESQRLHQQAWRFYLDPVMASMPPFGSLCGCLEPPKPQREYVESRDITSKQLEGAVDTVKES